MPSPREKRKKTHWHKPNKDHVSTNEIPDVIKGVQVNSLPLTDVTFWLSLLFSLPKETRNLHPYDMTRISSPSPTTKDSS